MLAAGVLLVAALVVFLAVGKWKNPFNRRDLPKRLGLDIQQEANGWTYTHGFRGHTLYKIHASRLVQMKQSKHVLLHDVKIELYGQDGSSLDTIEGNEFEYDPDAGTVKATGPVEIALMRPSQAPAIAPKATPDQAVSGKISGKPLAAAARTAASGAIHVKTNGLIFDQKSGVATAPQRVEFSLKQGSGSAMGAIYDSQQGTLALDRSVELTTTRAGEPVNIYAQHAEFVHGDQLCTLREVTANYRGGEATAHEAKILFRTDGSAVRLDATGGFTMATATGGHLAAPIGQIEFNEHNQPRHGHMQGGVTIDSVSAGRQMHGTSPSAELEFTSEGQLRHAHLERGVELHSEQLSEVHDKKGTVPLRESRDWRSPVADAEFRKGGHGQTELATILGTGGVVVTGESQRGKDAVEPSLLTADELTGQFGPGSELSAMTGVGHACLEETTATGTRQTTSGDRLQVQFGTGAASGTKSGAKNRSSGQSGAAGEIQSANVEGHVVMVQQPAAKSGAEAPAPMRATAGRAVYGGTGDWVHLTQSPRVEDGALQLTADKIDVSQASGDAFVHGNVKASWIGAENGKSSMGRPGGGNTTFGGQGPAHAVSAEAQLNQTTGEATFRGHARLWQQANSIAAPMIVLDRAKQTLAARSTDPKEPVRAVMVSSAGLKQGKGAAGKTSEASVIRVRGGELKYSNAERKAVMRGGALGTVAAETGTATSISNEVEVDLLPPGNHAGKQGGAAQVDRMTARGHVTVSSQGRRGTGERLVYTSETGEYVLTGTTAAPPRMTDPSRGTVTGEALIFHSRDDSVSIEGGGRETRTETTAPR